MNLGERVAVARSLSAVLKQRRPRIPVGTDAVIIALVERLFPFNYWRLLARMLNA